MVIAKLMEATVSARDRGDQLGAWAAGFLTALGSGNSITPVIGWTFSGGGGLRQLVRTDTVVYGAPGSGNRDSFPTWASRPLPPGSNVCTVDRLVLDLTSGNLVSTTSVSSGPEAPANVNVVSGVADFDWLLSRLPAQSRQDWLNSEKGLSPDLLIALTAPMPSMNGDRSLALAMVRWARTTGSDIAMEVSPVRDEIPLTVRTDAGCRAEDLLWAPDLGSRNLDHLLHATYDPLVPAKAYELDREAALISIHPWTVSEDGHVLVVKNRFGFLDHQLTLPFPLLLALRSDTGGEPCAPHFEWNDLLRYCTRASQDAAATVARARPPLAPSDLGFFCPFGRALASLSERRRNLESRLLESGRVELPVTALSTEARTDLERTLVHLALAVGDPLGKQPRRDFEAMLLHPDFDAGFKRLILRFEYKEDSPKDGTLTASLLGPALQDGEAPTELVRAVLENVAFRESN